MSDIDQKISIIIRTTPEREAFLEQSLESVNEQITSFPIEAVVVCDGGKEDKSKILAETYKNLDIIYHPTQVRVGRSNAANHALRLARGDLINFLDDDDILYKSHIDILAKILQGSPGIDAVYSGADQVSRIVESLSPLRSIETKSRYYFMPIETSYDLVDFNPFPIQSVMFRKKLLKDDVQFDTSLDALEDWLFWQKLLIGKSICKVNMCTSRFFVPNRLSEVIERNKDHNDAYNLFREKSDLISITLKDVKPMLTYYKEQQKLCKPISVTKAINRERVISALKNPRLIARYIKRKIQNRALAAAVESIGLPKNIEQIVEAQQRIFETPKIIDRLHTSGRNNIAVFTSVNSAYLDKALLLGESIKEYNVSVDYHIVYCDVIDKQVEGIITNYPSVDCLFPFAQLPIDNVRKWSFKRNVVELCTGVKPFYLEKLLQDGYEKVIYIDPDCRVFGKIDPLIDSVDRCSLSLTPHCDTVGRSSAQIRINELSSLAHGVFNLGYLGVKNDDVGRSVAHYWRSRVNEYGFDEIERGSFTDQKVFDLAPVFFPGMEILRHQGANVASWNVESRPISMRDGIYFAGEQPIIFFHFSGFDKGVPGAVASAIGTGNDVLTEIIDNYEKRLLEIRKNMSFTSTWPLTFFENGVEILGSFRVCYRNHVDLQKAFPDPYAVDGDNSYYGWIQHKGVESVIRRYDRSKWLPRFY